MKLVRKTQHTNKTNEYNTINKYQISGGFSASGYDSVLLVKKNRQVSFEGVAFFYRIYWNWSCEISVESFWPEFFRKISRFSHFTTCFLFLNPNKA